MSDGIRIAPSVLAADLTRLGEHVAQALAGGADWLHVDVMDGCYVPSITFGANMVAALRKLTNKPLDVHLMVVEPEKYIAPFADAGASVFTFHPDATRHVQRQLAAVKERGMLAGLALNPAAPLALVEDVASELDISRSTAASPHRRSAGRTRPAPTRSSPVRPSSAPPIRRARCASCAAAAS